MSANGNLGVRLIRNPNGSLQPVTVGGVVVIPTESEQSSGADAPTKSMESGAEITQRNVLVPNSGTISGAVASSGLGALRRQARTREFIRITTPEGSLPRCVVEDVSRTREGGHLDKFGVDIQWRQVFIANVGTAELRAITQDGPKSGAAGSGGGQQSLVGNQQKNTSNGPQVDASGDQGFIANTQQTVDGAAQTLGDIGNAVGDWQGGGQSSGNRSTLGQRQQSTQ